MRESDAGHAAVPAGRGRNRGIGSADGERSRRLGRGLDTLIPSAPAATSGGEQLQAPIGSISRNPSQPRQEFNRAELEQLAASIREHGILQPLLVRAQGTGGYELIAGERRWRAAGLAGLTQVPIVVQEVSDEDESGLTLALVENLQRSDLNPIEMASAFQRLAEAGWTQEQIAEQVGKSRTAVANSLRLRQLSPAIQSMVASGDLSEGHGRALLGAPQAERAELAQRALDGEWTVRRLEEAVRALSQSKPAPAQRVASPAVINAIRQLESALGTRVEVRAGSKGSTGGGRIVIHWYDDEQLASLAARLAGDGSGNEDETIEFGV